jgi:hypothetical protein
LIVSDVTSDNGKPQTGLRLCAGCVKPMRRAIARR